MALVGGCASIVALAASIALPAAVVTSGCASCGDCYALDSFTIRLSYADRDALPDGEYRVAVEAGGEVFEIVATIDGGVPSCPDGCLVGDEGLAGVELYLDPRPSLVVFGTPAVVTVSVDVDGARGAQETFEPRYVEGEPICCNGGSNRADGELEIGGDGSGG